MKLIYLYLVIGFVFFEKYADAVTCQKYSTFNIGEDECECSADGKAYCCKVTKCDSEVDTENRFMSDEEHKNNGEGGFTKEYEGHPNPTSGYEGDKYTIIDQEGSGDDLEGSGSGSGDYSLDDYYLD